MEILVDTNVFLDMVLNRPGCGTARNFFVKATRHGGTIFVSASAATDIFYIVRKNRGVEQAYEALDFIFDLALVAPVTDKDILDAWRARWKDFEDCVQYTTAWNHRLDLLVTNNKADYEEHGLPVMTPDEYVNNALS